MKTLTVRGPVGEYLTAPLGRESVTTQYPKIREDYLIGHWGNARFHDDDTVTITCDVSDDTAIEIKKNPAYKVEAEA